MKYFKPEEFACKCGKCGKGFADMKPELLSMLEDARALAGIPFTLTSAYRCADHNKRVGGKENSAHLRGYGVDIKVVDSRSAFKILTSLLEVGFTRIFYNDKHKFFHADCDPTLPQEVFSGY